MGDTKTCWLRPAPYVPFEDITPVYDVVALGNMFERLTPRMRDLANMILSIKIQNQYP